MHFGRDAPLHGQDEGDIDDKSGRQQLSDELLRDRVDAHGALRLEVRQIKGQQGQALHQRGQRLRPRHVQRQVDGRRLYCREHASERHHHADSPACLMDHVSVDGKSDRRKSPEDQQGGKDQRQGIYAILARVALLAALVCALRTPAASNSSWVPVWGARLHAALAILALPAWAMLLEQALEDEKWRCRPGHETRSSDRPRFTKLTDALLVGAKSTRHALRAGPARLARNW
mmetsp:Transcript_9314/g.25273  ORF Transcript_9314/g.25273 Transcript_9314/m.25273 type:complete len:231 (+) Transcript_9314:804-1496(+)